MVIGVGGLGQYAIRFLRLLTDAEVVAEVPDPEGGEGARTEVRLAADDVLLAGGVGPDPSLAEAIGAALGPDVPVHVVGDAGEVGYIEGAIRSGHDVACTV